VVLNVMMTLLFFYVLSQLVQSTSKEKFLRDPNAATVFKAAVATLVPGLQPSNVEILNVTQVGSGSAARTTPHAAGMHSATRIELADSTGLIIDYKLVFVAQRVLVTRSDPAEAFQLTSRQLEKGMRSSAFNAVVQTLAQELNSTAMSSATSDPMVFGVEQSFTTEVVHSAVPTSQPSTQPSSYPTAQPSGQPTCSPTAQPSAQPSTMPSGQPSAAPTMSVETDWMNETATAFSRYVSASVADRSSYYTMEVNSVSIFGDCQSWTDYLTHSLRVTRRAKVFHSLSFVSESGREEVNSVAYTCSDPARTDEFMQALSAPLGASVAVNVTLVCGGHTWVARDCVVPVDSRAAHVANVSRALCVDCDDPCTEYDCLDLPGRAVLAPCNSVENCGARTGSLQVFVAEHTDSAGAGYNSVLIWFGVLWGYLILSVLGYDMLVRAGCDVAWLRRPPALSFVPSTADGRPGLYAVAPDIEVAGGNRPGTASSIDETAAGTSLKGVVTMMSTVLSRLTVIRASAGWETLGFTVVTHQRYWHRLLSYNHYLAPYTSTTQRKRLLHGLDVLTRVSWLFFCVALCLWLNYPEDDDSCYLKATAQECGQRVTPFDSSQEYCTWVGESHTSDLKYDGGQSWHQAQCLWRYQTGSMVTVLHIVVLAITAVAIPRTVYTNFLMDSVLLAPGAAGRTFVSPTTCIDSAPARRSNKVQHASGGVITGGSGALEVGDARFLSLTMTEGTKGGPQSYLESGSPQDTAELLYKSFAFEFTQYKSAILSIEDDRSAEFAAEWWASNPYLFRSLGSVPTGAGASEESTEAADERDKELVTKELFAVHQQAEGLVPGFKNLAKVDEDQFSVRLMTLFFADLLGKDSIQCRLVRAMLRDLLQDSASFRDVRNWVKFCVLLFMLATCMCLVYGSIALLEHFSARRQWYWVITAALAVAVDMVLVEGVEALWIQWALPLCVADTLTALRQTFSDIVHRFERSQLKSAGSITVKTTATSSAIVSGLKDFSMPSYQFVSTNLAQRFPRHVASRIVLSYESVYPRTITGQRWPCYRTAQWSSGLGIESVGYVIFSRAAMWVSIHTPRYVIQVVITGLTSLALWLVSWAVLNFLHGDYAGVLIVAAALAVLLLVAASYRYSWDHDSEHYGDGYSALQVASVLRKPPTAVCKLPEDEYATAATAASPRRARVNFNTDTDGKVEDHFPPRPSTATSSPVDRVGTARSALSSRGSAEGVRSKKAHSPPRSAIPVDKADVTAAAGAETSKRASESPNNARRPTPTTVQLRNPSPAGASAFRPAGGRGPQQLAPPQHFAPTLRKHNTSSASPSPTRPHTGGTDKHAERFCTYELSSSSDEENKQEDSE
jgi:hypothetical protein